MAADANCAYNDANKFHEKARPRATENGASSKI